MGTCWALVGDTWRQSKQQVVFLLLAAAMALSAVAAVALPRVLVVEGEGEVLSLLQRGIATGFQAPGLTPLEKGVQVWASGWVGWLFKLSMWGFIAASAGYFPELLRAGAVDAVVAKPLRRVQIFACKYLGGLALYGVVLLGVYAFVFVGLGVRTGVWHLGLFAGIPLTWYAVALLYALVACVGIFTRSTALSMVLGYGFYFVVDSAIGVLQWVGQSRLPEQFAWVRSLSEWSRWSFPGFSRLQHAATAAVIHGAVFDWQPILVGCGWLAACLAVGYWWFWRMDL